MIRQSMRHLAEFWCKTMHPSPMWPINGHYLCRKCLRKYPVKWELGSDRAHTRKRAMRLP